MMSHITQLCHLAAEMTDIPLKLLLVDARFDVTYLPQGVDGITHRQEPCSGRGTGVFVFSKAWYRAS